MANRYWRGGTGIWNTTSTTNWSATSGGGGGASVPTAADTVIFDQAATYTVTLTGALTCLDFLVQAGTVTFTSTGTPTISGSMSLVVATVWSGTGTTTFNATTAKTITTNGVTLGCPVTLDGVGGAWSLGSTLTLNTLRTLQLNNGSFDLNGFNAAAGAFVSNNSNTRSVAFGANNISVLHATAATFVVNIGIATNFTWTGTGGFISDAAVTRSYACGGTGGTATNAVNLTIAGSGTQLASFAATNWWKKLDFGSTTFTVGAITHNIASLTLSSAGTYTSLTVNVRAGGVLIFNSKSCGALAIGHTGTTTLGSAGGCSTFTTTLTPTLDCAGFSFIGSGTFTWVAAATVILGTNGTFGTTGSATITGQTFAPTTGQTYTLGSVTATSCTFNLTLGGNLSCSGPFSLTSSTFTYEGTGTFTKTGGFNFTQGTGSTVTFNKSNVHDPLGRYDHSAGDLIIGSGVTLTLGTYRSSTSVARSIAFGTSTAGNIVLASSVDTATVLQISDSTNFTRTGPGGFVTDAALARTITIVNTGVTALNSVNLTLTGSGTAQITISSNGWFNKLDFGTTTFTLSATTVTLNVNGITLSPTGTYTTLVVNAVGTGQIIGNSRTVNTVNINNGAGTATLGSALSCTSFNQVAGNIDFQSFSVSCTNLAWTAGTYTNMGTITSVVFNIQGTFSFTSGTINSSNSVTVTAPFTYGGTATLGNTSNFFHTSSTVTFNKSYTGASTYTLTAGTLTLNSNVTTNTFTSSNSNTRDIAFSTFYITITSLSMATATGFSASGTGGFSSTMSATRTFNCGATAAPTVAPNLSIIGGASIPTFTSGSWFKNLDFTGSTCTPALTTINLAGITLSATGNFANLGTLVLTGSGNLRTNGNTTLNTPTFSGTGTTTLTGTCSFANGTSITHTSGTIDLNGFDMYCGNSGSLGVYDSGSSSSARSVIFGTNNIICAAISCAAATGFTWTGTTGGFQIPGTTSSITVFGTTNGSTTNAPNLTFTTGAWGGGSITTGSWFNKLTFNSGFTGSPGTTTINVNSLELSSGGTFTGLTIAARGTGTITSNGRPIAALTVNTTGTATLLDAFSANGAFTLTQGTLNISTFSLASGTFASTGSATRSLIGSGTYTVLGSTFSGNDTGLTVTGIIISMTLGASKIFSGGNGTYPVLNQGSTGPLIIQGSNTFGDLTTTTRPTTIRFTTLTTQTFAAFTLSGVSGSLVKIELAVAGGAQYILSKASGTVSVDYLSIQDCNATGGAAWYAGTTSTNVSNNLGWIFTAPPGPGGAYAGNFFAFF
jgi:hypothetical protein